MKNIRKTYWYGTRKLRRIEYYKCGLLHREDGPAVIQYYENGTIEREYYFVNRLRHRLDGPAVISYHYDGLLEKEEYAVNGERYEDMLQWMIAVGNYKDVG